MLKKNILSLAIDAPSGYTSYGSLESVINSLKEQPNELRKIESITFTTEGFFICDTEDFEVFAQASGDMLRELKAINSQLIIKLKNIRTGKEVLCDWPD